MKEAVKVHVKIKSNRTKNFIELNRLCKPLCRDGLIQ